MLQDKASSPSFIPHAKPLDTGLAALVTLLGFHDLPADAEQLKTEFVHEFHDVAGRNAVLALAR